MASELEQIADALTGINEKMGRFIAHLDKTSKDNDEWLAGRVSIDALTHTALLNAVCKLSDHFDKWFELQNNPRVFVSKQPEQEEFEDQDLYWSNEDGWVSLNMADLFSNEEKDRYNLPVGGSWLHTIDGWVVEQAAKSVERK